MAIIKTDFSLMGSDDEIPFTRRVHNLELLGGSQTDAPPKKRKDTSSHKDNKSHSSSTKFD